MELLALSLLLITTARHIRARAAVLGTCTALVAALLGLAARVSRSTSGTVLTVALLAVVAGVAIASAATCARPTPADSGPWNRSAATN